MINNFLIKNKFWANSLFNSRIYSYFYSGISRVINNLCRIQILATKVQLDTWRM